MAQIGAVHDFHPTVDGGAHGPPFSGGRSTANARRFTQQAAFLAAVPRSLARCQEAGGPAPGRLRPASRPALRSVLRRSMSPPPVHLIRSRRRFATAFSRFAKEPLPRRNWHRFRHLVTQWISSTGSPSLAL